MFFKLEAGHIADGSDLMGKAGEAGGAGYA